MKRLVLSLSLSLLSLLFLSLLTACGANAPVARPREDVTPSLPADDAVPTPPDDDAGSEADDALASCMEIEDTKAFRADVYFAREGARSSGAWVAVFVYPPEKALFPSAFVEAIVLDRDDELVGRRIDLATQLLKIRGAPLVRPIFGAVCNGAPPCAEGEQAFGYVSAEGKAVVHEHATVSGGRFAFELWTTVFKRNVAASGVTFSDDPRECIRASRIFLTGPVEDVTERCPTADAATDPYAYAACTYAARAMD